jgi:hypothetical protein
MYRRCKYSTSEFIEISNKVHNNRYIYYDILFSKTTDKISIFCEKHGYFSQKVSDHLSGKGCRECYYDRKSSNLENFIKKAKVIYNDEFNYSEFIYINSKTESIIKCKYGHSFKRTPNRHLTKNDFCNECKKDSYIKNKISKINFKGFEYTEWKGEIVTIKCIDCLHIFSRKINAHIKLKNCPKCNPNRDNKEIFIKKSVKIHGNTYDYSKLEYLGSKSKVTLICKNGHEIKQKANNHLRGIGCPTCNRFDKKELSVIDFIKENYNSLIIKSDRNILEGKELDIYLPDLNLAFEFNGLYWHSDLFKDKRYHQNKTKDCLDKGIQLIHIWEDDWNNKQDIVKSIILNKLGKSEKVWARNCIIKEINDNKLVREFLSKNHIQDFIGSKIKIGLFYNGELVSLMIFGSLRKSLGTKTKEGSYELLRFCNKLNMTTIGGASRLFSFFLKNFKPKEVISYSDNSRGVGELYSKLGFEFLHETCPNYYWVVNGIRKHRFNFRKDKLIREGADPNKTEVEIMNEMSYYRIFDCGSKKWKLINSI